MSKSLYDMIDEIDNKIDGLHFEKIEGVSVVGSPFSGAPLHPIQYRAITNVIDGMDDSLEGIGWTPSEAVRNLLRQVIYVVEHPYNEEETEEASNGRE